MPTDSCNQPVVTNHTSLNLHQVKQLLREIEQAEHASCAAAVGLMLLGGVNYNELKRWVWQDILEETPRSQAAVLSAPARRWMKKLAYMGVPEASVLPRGWRRHWLRLKEQLGIRDAQVLKETHRQWHTAAAFVQIFEN